MPSAVDNNTGNPYAGLNFNTESDIKAAAKEVKDQVLTQEDFLKLLTTQLEAQDPTNPADNTELVSQMSQLSMVESLNSINSSMDGVIDTVTSSSALTATSLIGTYVYSDTNKGYYDGASTVAWSIDAGQETYYNLQLTIKDAQTGEVVYTDTADALSGETKFAWPGIYSPEGPVADTDTGVQKPTEKPEEGTGTDNSTGDSTSGSESTDGTQTAMAKNGSESDGDTASNGDAKPETPEKNPEYTYCNAGRYILEVTGTNSAGQAVALPTTSLALVTSVTLGKTMADTKLTLYGQGDISFEDAKKVTI